MPDSFNRTEQKRHQVETESPSRSDLACGRSAWFLWGAPWGLIAVGAVWSTLIYWLWIPAFLVAGVACVYNARRCGRLHCFVTGPLFLLAAAYVSLAAADLVPLGVVWFLSVVFGIAVIAQFAERKFGTYRAAPR